MAWKGLTQEIGQDDIIIERTRLANLGKKHSTKTKQKMALADRSYMKIPEYRLKVSLAKKGQSNGLLGKKMTDIHKLKISQARKLRFEGEK